MTSKRAAIAPLLGVVGGLLVVVAYATRLGTVEGTAPGSLGLQIKTGALDLVIGIVVIALAVAAMVLSPGGGAVGAHLAQLLVSAVAFALGLYLLVSNDAFIRRAASAAGVTTAQLARGVSAGFVSVSRGAGPYL